MAASTIASPASASAAAPLAARGWKFVHVCIADASCVGFSQILPDQKKESAVAFLFAAITYYLSLGVTVARVMTDNGSCYRSKVFREACRDLGLKHIRTRPYTPKTNGKAERFIQTLLREWATPRPIRPPSDQHRNCPTGCTDTTGTGLMDRYNPPPISRLALTEDNLLRLHS